MDTRTADDIVTVVTQAPTREAALAALVHVPRATLLATADLLYIDGPGRASATLRKAIVSEARAGMDAPQAQRTRATR